MNEQESTLNEKRKTERTPVAGAIMIYSQDGSDIVGDGHVVNLSEGGIRMVSDSDLEVGKKFNLHFSVPNSSILNFSGNIIHKKIVTGSLSYGIKFLEGQDTFLLKLFAHAHNDNSGYFTA